MMRCQASKSDVRNPQKFCPACGAPLKFKPSMKIIVGWTCFIALFVCGVIIMIADADKEAREEAATQVNGTYYIKDDTCGTPEKSDWYYVYQAEKNGDVQGMVALVSSGRAYKLDRGTEIHVVNCRGDLTYVTVESGRAIGRGLYVPVRDF